MSLCTLGLVLSFTWPFVLVSIYFFLQHIVSRQWFRKQYQHPVVELLLFLPFDLLLFVFTLCPLHYMDPIYLLIAFIAAPLSIAIAYDRSDTDRYVLYPMILNGFVGIFSLTGGIMGATFNC